MDPQSLNIDLLLTAARQLEKGQLLQGFPGLNISLPTTMSIPTSATDGFFQEFQENMQPSLSYGKMRPERKCSTASTSSMPYCPSMMQRKSSTKSSRAAHNELEKTRRANLRGCLEKLKSLVPPVSDAARNTTLALLTRARDHIQYLDNVNEQAYSEIQDERERTASLQAKLERLRAEKARREESVSNDSSARVSPVFMEYSPSTKPSYSPRAPLMIDPIAEGLLPALPISFPRPSVYPFFDLNPVPASQTSFLPIHLSV